MTRFHNATANARSHVSRATRLVPLVSWLALAACSDTYTTTSYTDPDSFMETDEATVTGSLSFDPTLAYTGPNGANENHSTDAYRFDVAPFMDDAEKSAAQKLYPSHAAQLAANPGGIPSVQSIVTYVKQLDDTIYAGVEHAAETGGIPTLTAKRQLLADSLAWLVANPVAGAGDGAVALAAALELGGGSGDVPAALRSQVDASKSAFLADTFLSTPASFYTTPGPTSCAASGSRIATSSSCCRADRRARSPRRSPPIPGGARRTSSSPSSIRA